MFAQLTAFEVLTLVLVMGSIAALAGWAGGTGARLSFSARLDRVEGILMQVLNRAKGAAGQQSTARRRDRLSSAEAEAEKLAADLAHNPGLRMPGIPLAQRLRGLPEEQAVEVLEKEAQRRGFKPTGSQ